MSLRRFALRAACVPVLAACLAGCAFATAAHAQGAAAEINRRVREVRTLLDGWQYDTARQAAAALEAQYADVPAVQLALAEVAFHFGQYEKAMSWINQARAGITPGDDTRAFFEQVKATYGVSKNFIEYISPGNKFVIAVQAGKDELLPHFAFEALERAYDAIGRDLDYFPPPPVRVEIYNRVEDLAAVTTLTAGEIKNSGTIALCKYNRLMVTSPKALVRGYPWIDTVVHEYTHLVISMKTHNQVPIWLHEGLAKSHEARWRSDAYTPLYQQNAAILAWGLQTNNLITFEQMHPSMAKLPTQRATTLAFAEVHQAIDYLRATWGQGAIRKLLAYIGGGMETKRAVEQVTGGSFKDFQNGWMAYMRKLKLPPPDEPDKYEPEYKFRTGSPNSADDDDPAVKQTNEMTKFLHLGDLMRARGHTRAAALEYRKARQAVSDPGPVLANKLARTLMETSALGEAKRELEQALAAYPKFVTTLVNLGRIARRQGEDAEASRYFREAIAINPFHHEPHLEIVRMAEASGKGRKAAWRSELALGLIQGQLTSRKAKTFAAPDLPADTGAVSLIVTPPATIIHEGQPLGPHVAVTKPAHGGKPGVTTVSSLALKAGEHRFELQPQEGGRPRRFTIAVKAGHETQQIETFLDNLVRKYETEVDLADPPATTAATAAPAATP